MPGRHSRMHLAGIQKKSLDARLRGHDRWVLDTYLSGGVLSIKKYVRQQQDAEIISEQLRLWKDKDE
jgi:hypothetical protein